MKLLVCFTVLLFGLILFWRDDPFVYNNENSLFVYHPDVKYALDHGIPVVALESTIVSHGK